MPAAKKKAVKKSVKKSTAKASPKKAAKKQTIPAKKVARARQGDPVRAYRERGDRVPLLTLVPPALKKTLVNIAANNNETLQFTVEALIRRGLKASKA